MVLALLPYALGCAPSQRYRIEQWCPLLERDGVTVKLSPFVSPREMVALHGRGEYLAKFRGTMTGYRRRLRQLRHAPACDVVFLHREAFPLGPKWLERATLHRFSLVYDFDDPIYLPAPSHANPWTVAFKSTNKPAVLCGLARHVTAGNEVLADYARTHARDVSVVPSTIDTDQYRPPARPPNSRPVVGWTGSATTAPYLKTIHEPLLALRTTVDYELRIIGAQVSLPGLDVHCLPWRAETETRDLSVLDVGLMPLTDDPWTRGKSGMKALQYMALGIPPVVSPIGANRTIVTDGVNGFHAKDEADWVQTLTTLLGSPEMRARVGKAARLTVEERYSARVHAARLADIFRTVAAASVVRR